MKKWLNGNIVEMTAEEIADLERLAKELPPPEPTLEEKFEQLLAAIEEGLK